MERKMIQKEKKDKDISTKEELLQEMIKRKLSSNPYQKQL